MLRKDVESISFESIKENASKFMSKIQDLLETTLLDFEISSELSALLCCQEKCMS